MSTVAADPDLFERERRRLFGIAYRMLGTVADADDIVQEAWLRYQGAEGVERPEAFLTTVVTRLAIDRLRSAQRQRESYVGPWLPEPVLTDRDPAHIVELDETVTLGFMHVLERLGPVDRAVFLLHDVFDLPYPEIAEVVGRSEANCRQIARRARERIRSERPRFTVDAGRRKELLDAFMAAVLTGQPDELESLLADDVVLVSDGGPNRHAARHPIVGPKRLARFLQNLAQRLPAEGSVEIVEVNGEPAALASVGGEPFLVTEVELDGDRVRRIHVVVNPDKLAAVRDCYQPRS